MRHELADKRQETKLTLTQHSNATQEEADHSEQNWNMVLGQLKELLEK